ncbi:MAG: 16S rRNA (cytidine(1402)-2'-O)-methyltransferase [Anaerolineae bacterium]|nr:16S rRNA (cytidine(1402)-2'-O)-methyltransferase [Anaerolineae bacterium]
MTNAFVFRSPSLVNMGTLYLVATPIGNLEDITLRALRVLKGVSLIVAEDTRTARKLLTHYGITTPVTSYFEHNKLTKLDTILRALEQGDVAVISEAGTPGLSDPGYELVRAALARGYRIVPIPGANAVITALVASGLPTDQFVYVGFLPRQRRARRRLLQSLANEPRTLIAYEAPHRVQQTLDDIAEILGNRTLCIARELTKMYEEFFRGTVDAAREHFRAHTPRGEFTLVIAGTEDRRRKTEDEGRRTEDEEWDDARVQAAVRELMTAGIARTEAVKQVARRAGRARREVYRLTQDGGRRLALSESEGTNDEGLP